MIYTFFGFCGGFYAKPRLRAEALFSATTFLFPTAKAVGYGDSGFFGFYIGFAVLLWQNLG
jgi:hypothetical protein